MLFMPPCCVEVAFGVAKAIASQSLALDFVRNIDQPVVVEISCLNDVLESMRYYPA